jgi:hypothetical protein
MCGIRKGKAAHDEGMVGRPRQPLDATLHVGAVGAHASDPKEDVVQLGGLVPAPPRGCRIAVDVRECVAGGAPV